MPHDVFVSHSSKDRDAADAVVALLERAGIRCWAATRDILPGTSWASAVMRGINDCRAMVVVFSSSANASDHVRREVERAVARGIPVVPLRIEDVRPAGDLEYFLSASHWMDALPPAPVDAQLGTLAHKLARLIGNDVPAEDAAAADDDREAAAREPASPAFPASRDRQGGSGRVGRFFWPDPPPDDHPRPLARRVLRVVVCLVLFLPAIPLLILPIYLVVQDVLANGTKAATIADYPTNMTVGITVGISLYFVFVVSMACRRRPWAIVTGATSAFALTVWLFAVLAEGYRFKFGDAKWQDWSSPLPEVLAVAVVALPAYCFMVLAAIELAPAGAGTFKLMWQPLWGDRPRWFGWLRRGVGLCVAGLVMLWLASAMTAELRRRTPLDAWEQDLVTGSWRVVASTPRYGRSLREYHWADVGNVWTFDADHDHYHGRVNYDRTAFLRFAGNEDHTGRWQAPDAATLTISAWYGGDGTKYRVDRPGADTVVLTAVEDPNIFIRLERVSRLSADEGDSSE